MTPAESAYRTSAVETGRGDDPVMQELSQVYYIAKRIRERLPQQIELEDLVSAGVIGLIEAARSFDSTKSVQFKTFASFRIRGAIMDSLREGDWGSRHMRRMGREITEATNRIQSKLGRTPSESEIAAEMGIETAKLRKLVAQIDSLQITGQQIAASADNAGAVDLIESAPNLTDPDPLETFLKGEEKAQLAEAIARLTEREQLILSLYYREELTMKEISQVVGITLSRVSQIREAAIGKLKTFLAENHAKLAPSPVKTGGRFKYA